MKTSKGFGLIDTVIALGLFGASVFLVTSAVPALKLTRHSNYNLIAGSVAESKIEEIRTLGYAALTDQTQTTFNTTALADLPNGTGRYTVAGFDADNNGAVDVDIKRVSVTVTWREAGQTKTHTLETLMSKTGLSQ